MRISDWSSDVCSSDLVAVLGDRRPAEALQALQQGADAALAGVGQRAEVVQRVAELLVLGADAPSFRRLAAGLQVFDELCLVGDDFALALRRSGHALISSIQARSEEHTSELQSLMRL